MMERTMIRRVAHGFHLFTLLLSLVLVVDITCATFRSLSFVSRPGYLRLQLWVCIFFLVDFVVQWMAARRKGRYFFTHLLFLLVSIPYLNIANLFGWQLDDFTGYLVRLMPLLRGGYAMLLIIGWYSRSRVSGLFFSYLVMLLSSVYFASLIFFVQEWGVNPAVGDYWDSLWWAFMNVTTVGSNIIASTVPGKILAVLLAALGMMAFPVFTVYITDLIKKDRRRGNEAV